MVHKFHGCISPPTNQQAFSALDMWHRSHWTRYFNGQHQDRIDRTTKSRRHEEEEKKTADFAHCADAIRISVISEICGFSSSCLRDFVVESPQLNGRRFSVRFTLPANDSS
jgi:hypothetical protein